MNTRSIIPFAGRKTRIFRSLLALIVLTLAWVPAAGSTTVLARGNSNLFLPMISGPAGGKLLLGIYPHAFLGPTTSSHTPVDDLVVAADAWAGKKHSIVATFFDLESGNPNYNLYEQLETLWRKGYTPFINLGSKYTAYDIASGKVTANIDTLATAYYKWVKIGGGRKAFLAPLPEMNGYWPSYREDAPNFKIAYDLILERFARITGSNTSAWWVFAPNGWSMNGQEFENYYPGDSKVDAVGFSSYNYGFCAVGDPAYRKWQGPQALFEPYIDRMRAMAPTKPVIITQTGSTDQYPNEWTHDSAKRDQWLQESYDYLASKTGVMAVLYYDYDLSNASDCNWTVFNRSDKASGYPAAAADSRVVYMSGSQLQVSGFTYWK